MSRAFWKFRPIRLAGIALLVAALGAPPTIALGQDDPLAGAAATSTDAGLPITGTDAPPAADNGTPAPSGTPGEGSKPPESAADNGSKPPANGQVGSLSEPGPAGDPSGDPKTEPTSDPSSTPSGDPTPGGPTPSGPTPGGPASGDPPQSAPPPSASPQSGEGEPDPTPSPSPSGPPITVTLQDATGTTQNAQTVTNFAYDAVTDLQASPKLLWITAQFPAGSTDRQISIDFNNLLMPASGIGLQPNGSGALGAPWTTDFLFDAALLPAHAQGIVTGATYTPALDHGEQVGGGNLTYSFADSADDMTAVVTTFLTVNPTYAWKLDAGPLTRGLAAGDLAPVVASASFEQSGGGSQTTTSNIENVTFTDGSGAGLKLVSHWDAAVRHPGDSGTFYLTVAGAVGSDDDDPTFGARLHELHWRFAVAKALGVQNVTTTAGGSFSFAIDRDSSPTFDYIDITATGEVSLRGEARWTFAYAIDADAPATTVQFQPAIDTGAPASLTMVDGHLATATDLRPMFWANSAMKITSATDGALGASALTDIGFPANPPDQILLAGIGLDEINGFDVNNATFAVDFDQVPGVIGVETIRVGRAAEPAQLANIAITTTKGNTITVEQKDYLDDSVIFAKTDFSGTEALADDEYFAAITFDYVGLFPANWSANSPSSLDFFISAFGTYLGSPVNTPDAYALALIMAWNGAALGDPAAVDYVWSIGHHASGIVNAVLNQTGSLSDVVMAGTRANVSLQVSVPAAIHSIDNQIYWRGVTWYLRKGDLLTYDRSSFSVTARDITSPTLASRTFTEAGGGLIVEYVEKDAAGWPYWKITAPNAYLLQDNADLPGAPPSTTPTLSFAVRVNTAAQTGNHSYADYFLAAPADSTKGVWSGTADSYDLTGLGKPDLLLAAPTGAFETLRNAILVLDTAVQSDASPDWLSYDFATGSDEMVLGAGDTLVNRQVAYYNGSGGVPDRITIMIPVPKQGQSVPSRIPGDPVGFDPTVHLQAQPFGFTENLTAAVLVPAEVASFFTVSYAARYVTNRTSTAWQDWSAIADPSTIRMVKIEGTSIPGSVAEAIFKLSLEVPGSPDARRAQAGAANTFAAWHDSLYAATTHFGPTGATSVRLGTGQVSGTVFLDAGADGARDPSDSGLADIVVQAVRPGTNEAVATTTTAVDGSYTVAGLQAADVDIVFINPDAANYHFTATGPGLDSAAVPTADHSSGRAAGVDAGSAAADVVDAGLVGRSHVTFMPEGGSAVADQAVFPGQGLSEPATWRLGYNLTGWFRDAGLMMPWDFSADTVGLDMTLWAAWEAKTGYTVTYALNYVGAPASPGDRANLAWTDTNLAPSTPTRAGYDFAGWWTVAAATGGIQITATTTYADLVADDTTMSLDLFARWTAKTGFTVIYDLNHPEGGTNPEGKTGLSWISTGLIPRFTAPPVGWSLAGWFTEPEGGTAVNAVTSYGNYARSDDPAVPLVLYAHWTDIVMPTATVAYRGSPADSLQNRLTYGLFFTAGLPVTIYGASDRSAVTKVEYLTTTDTFISPAAALAWGNQSDRIWTGSVGTSTTFTIPATQTGRMLIFARVTNGSGNAGVYFDSITLYVNSEQQDQSAIFIRGTAADVTVDAALNGNSIAQIVNTAASGGGTVTASNYSVDQTGGADGQGSITVLNNYLTSLSTGTYTFMVSYNPASLPYRPDDMVDARNQAPLPTSFTIHVLKQAQAALSITGLNLSLAYTYGDPAISLGVQGGSGRGVIDWLVLAPVGAGVAVTPLSSADGEATLTLGKPGRISLRATKASDSTYSDMATASVIVTVNKATPVVSLNATGAGAYGQPITLTATVARVGTGLTPSGTVSFYIDSNPVVTNPVSLNAAGIASYTIPGSANLALGNHTFEVRYSGDSNYKGYGPTTSASADPIAQATRSFVVGRTSQTIAIQTPGAMTWGDADFTLTLANAGAGSGKVTWTASPTGILLISGTTASIVNTGTVTITATKAADDNFNSATATTTITVGKALPIWGTPASGGAIAYGQRLSASTLSGAIVKGAGTRAAETVIGTVRWNAGATLPDVTGTPGARSSYAVTFTPTGADANRYRAISGSATLTVDKITPSMTATPSGTPILPAPHDTLAESIITGGAMSFWYGDRLTAVTGHWAWDEPDLAWAEDDSGLKYESATFTPNDTNRFRSIAAMIAVDINLPKTVIINGPVASPIYYGDRIQQSDLDAFFAAVEADNGEGQIPIGGTWAWTEPETRVTNSGEFLAQVTFTPNELAPDPLVAGVGYVTSTIDVAIPVLKATPTLEQVAPGNVVSGQTLSTARLGGFQVVGAFGETVPGTLVWTYPEVIPSTVLDGSGVYSAVATFTPESGAFAEAYEVTEFPVLVQVVARVEGLEKLDVATIRPIVAGLHADNYRAEDIQAVNDALAEVDALQVDPYATASQIEDAADALREAFWSLVHDHSVLAHSLSAGVTQPSDCVSVQFKGDLRDATGIWFNGVAYGLIPAGDGFVITDGATEVGTITSPAVTVTLNADLLGPLSNGNYELLISFTDNHASGEGVAQIMIARTAGVEPGDPGDPGDADPSGPGGADLSDPGGAGSSQPGHTGSRLAVTGPDTALPLRAGICLTISGLILIGSIALRWPRRGRGHHRHHRRMTR